jgi:hypothetical protein
MDRWTLDWDQLTGPPIAVSRAPPHRTQGIVAETSFENVLSTLLESTDVAT